MLRPRELYKGEAHLRFDRERTHATTEGDAAAPSDHAPIQGLLEVQKKEADSQAGQRGTAQSQQLHREAREEARSEN